MKTSELIGHTLDLVVELLEKKTNQQAQEVIMCRGKRSFSPSTNWSQGGPIIEREEIDLNCYESPKTGVGWWSAEITGTKARAKAHTPLIAAMRCYVASKLGDEVEIPEGLS